MTMNHDDARALDPDAAAMNGGGGHSHGGVAVGVGDVGDGRVPRAMKRYAVPTFRTISVVRTAGNFAYGADAGVPGGDLS